MAFDVRISKKAETELLKILRSGQGDVVERIAASIEELAADPFRSRSGVDILQLKSIEPKCYRLRVGNYRVLYSVNKKQKLVNVTMILHRKRAYR